MFYKLILIAASASIAHCALLGHISYASDPINRQPTGVNYQPFVNTGLYGNPLYGQQQQQVAFQQIPTYAQYATPVLQSNYIQSPAVGIQQQQPQLAYGVPLIPQQTVQYQSPPLNGFGQFLFQQQQLQQLPPQRQQQSFGAFNGYANSPVVTQQFSRQPASFAQVQSRPPQQFAAVQPPQSTPVQNYQSLQVQPLQQTITPNMTPRVPAAGSTPPRITTVQHFPARPLPPNNNNSVMKQPKNAHHYPATVNRPATVQVQQPQQAQKPQQQSAVRGSSQGTNSGFRTSFSTAAAAAPQQRPDQQRVVPLPSVGQQPPQALRSPAVFPTNAPQAVSSVSPFRGQPQVIQNTPYFTETVIPASNLRSPAPQPTPAATVASLSRNPINIPPSSLVAPVRQATTFSGQQGRTQVQQTQQVPRVQLQPVAALPAVVVQPQFQPQAQTAKYSPSTAVSHAKFSGMGVQWEW